MPPVLSNIHKTPPCVQEYIVPIILGALREFDNGQYSKTRGANR